MEFLAKDIASLIAGKVEGDPERKINTISKIEEADFNSLCFIGNPKYEHFLYETKAGIVIVSDTLILQKPVASTLIRVSDAYASFALLMEHYQKIIQKKRKSGIDKNSAIAETVHLGDNVYIGAFSYIEDRVQIASNVQIYPQVYIGEDVEIGEGTIIYPGAKIYANCKIGNHVIIHSGAIIGSDGFGFAAGDDGRFKKIPQLGNVVLEDFVEVGANTTIDRATMGSTIIRENAKLDNLIQIAHNVVIGKNTAVAAQTGISGSTKIGENCLIGGQSGIVGHIEIADQTKLSARSGVSKSIKKPGTTLSGFFAFDYKESLKSQVIFKNLPNLVLRIEKIEEQIKVK